MNRRTIEELEQDEREKLVIDIRKAMDFERETYPGAVNICWEEFEEHLAEVPKEKPVYLICYTGAKSDEFAEELLEQGYDVYSVEGGYRSYLRWKLQQLGRKDEDRKDHCREIERSFRP